MGTSLIRCCRKQSLHITLVHIRLQIKRYRQSDILLLTSFSLFHLPSSYDSYHLCSATHCNRKYSILYRYTFIQPQSKNLHIVNNYLFFVTPLPWCKIEGNKSVKIKSVFFSDIMSDLSRIRFRVKIRGSIIFFLLLCWLLNRHTPSNGHNCWFRNSIFA